MKSEPLRAVEAVQPEGWPRPSGYSNAMRVPVGRDLLFLAGQVGWDEQQRLVGEHFVAQFEQALRNCVTIVTAAGGVASDIVRVTVFCASKRDYLDHLRDVGEVWRKVIGRHYPAMSLVEVADLLEDGALVEIEATAALLPAESR